jgi:murein L,D-transpeptidase YcbB/YkuD
MPLAHWPGVTTAMADVLRQYGIRTVEEVRDLGDGHLDKIRLPNMRELRLSAKAFLENVRTAESAQREVDRDQEITALQEALKEQNERLEAAMALLEAKTAPSVSPGAEDDDVEALRAELKAKGITFHHKAGAATLRALLTESAV